MKHSKRLQRDRERRQANAKSSSPRPARPLWAQMLMLVALGTIVIWAVLLNTGLVPNIFGIGKWTQEFFPKDERIVFGEALDEGRVNVIAAQAIIDGDYRLVGEIEEGLTSPIGVTCKPGEGPNWGDRSQFRFIVGDTDIMVRSAQTHPRQIRLRKYYGESFNKELVTFEDYPYKDVCAYTGMRLDGPTPVLPNQFGIVTRPSTDDEPEDTEETNDSSEEPAEQETN